jgi:hypothetical protein
MKTPDAIVEHVLKQIGYIYFHRPLLYGLTGTGVSVSIHNYHRIWAFIVGREDDLRDAYDKQIQEEGCGSADFATCYRLRNPDASEEEIANYVVHQWIKISDRVKIPIPQLEE